MTLNILKSLLANEVAQVEAYVSFDTEQEMIAWKHEWLSYGGIVIGQTRDSDRITLRVSSCIEL